MSSKFIDPIVEPAVVFERIATGGEFHGTILHSGVNVAGICLSLKVAPKMSGTTSDAATAKKFAQSSR